MIKRLIVCFALLLASGFALANAIQVYEFDSQEHEDMFRKLSQELRCPKCQNNNIADSNAELAQDLRQKVFEMIKAGKSEDEIVDYMIARYGNFVTYNPPLTLSTIILWVGPALVILLGFTMLVLHSRKGKSKSSLAMLDENEQKRLDALLNDLEQPDDKNKES